MTDTSFAKEYQRLNVKQKQAVDTIEGPVMVIAGPGTGKTQVLTLRIANILQTTDANPQNILALTFTDSGATTMRKRLIGLIGTQAYRVRIQTFHAFCHDVISQYPEYFPFGIDAIPASDIQTHSIMEKLLDNPKLTSLRTPGSKYHYLKKILSAITTLKSEGITPRRFKELVQAEVDSFEQTKDTLSKTARTKQAGVIAKQQELCDLYVSYQKELRTTGLIDFADMIVHTVDALEKNETLRTLLQENLQYILVDEYQDTNGAQNTVVDLLANFWGESANVFVVGDPHQTIFRFQGASFENTIGFLTRYPKTKVITLSTGYRCPPAIYRSAHELITKNTSSQELLAALAQQNPAVSTLVQGIAKPLTASHEHTATSLSLAIVPSELDEVAWIAHAVQTQLASGVSPDAIGLLVKTNEQAGEISTIFSQYSIAHHVDRTTDALTTEFGQQLFTLLQLLVVLSTNQESAYVYPVLSAPWMNLPPLAVMSLTRAFAKQRRETSFLSYIQSGWTEIKKSAIAQVTQEDYDSILTKISTILELAQLSHTFAVPNWLANVYQELGITAWIESRADAHEYLSVLQAFHNFAVTNYSTNHGLTAVRFVELLKTMETQQLPLSISADQETETVTIATVHKAKGREWDYVYIPKLCDGNWGGGKNRNALTLPEGIIATQTTDDLLEDDRRLFYVALTRAKQTVALSYSQTNQEQGKTNETLPSQLLLELPKDQLTKIDISGQSHTNVMLHTLRPIPSQSFGDTERAWIKAVVDDMALSVSALNTYLRDPQEFFTTHILKVPQTVASHLAFGNAVHAALEQHYKTYKLQGNTHPDHKLALSVFEEKLRKEIMSANDFSSRKTQGHHVLTDYLTHKREQFPQILALEEGFGWKRGPIVLGDIKLSGKVDRMDIIDESEHLVHIIDYKTGKQKSQNQIEGHVGLTEMSERERALPLSIRGAMKRQLLFYKLLLSRDPLYKHWTIGKTTFDFVQSDNGKFVERSFYLDSNDVKLLEELIKEVMDEISSLKFLESLH